MARCGVLPEPEGKTYLVFTFSGLKELNTKAEASEGNLHPENVVSLYQVLFMDELSKQFAGNPNDVFVLGERTGYLTDIYVNVDTDKIEIDLLSLLMANKQASQRMATLASLAAKPESRREVVGPQLSALELLPFKKYWMPSLATTILTAPETLTSLAFLYKAFGESPTTVESFFNLSSGFSSNRILNIAKTTARLNVDLKAQQKPLLQERFDHYRMLIDTLRVKKLDLLRSYPSLFKDRASVLALAMQLKGFDPDRPELMNKKLHDYLVKNLSLRTTTSSWDAKVSDPRVIAAADKADRFFYLLGRVKILPSEGSLDTPASRAEFSTTLSSARTLLHFDVKGLGSRGLVEIYDKIETLASAVDALSNYASQPSDSIDASTLARLYSEFARVQSTIVEKTADYMNASIERLRTLLNLGGARDYSIWGAGDDVYLAIKGDAKNAQEWGEFFAEDFETRESFRVLAAKIDPSQGHSFSSARGIFHEGVYLIKHLEYLEAPPSYIYIDNTSDSSKPRAIELQSVLTGG